MTHTNNGPGRRSRRTRRATLARRLTSLLAATATALSVTTTLAVVAGLGAEASAAPAPGAGRVATLTAATSPTSVGRLTPRGCTGSPGAVSCDLYAKPGTIQVAGTNLPIWGFATKDVDSTGQPVPATAPGPLLVLTQGDTVTVTLHNGLNSNVSLALPGQAAVDNARAGDDVTGAAPLGTATYKFTASRPGTFVYEAGHTKDGARQVAMGLAGAMVVLPSTPGSSDGNPSGYPDTSYDDDAPLVLSEIDPALNNSPDPLTFDMRNYRPAYRLVNGQAFPQTNSLATDQGHKVLLRYVNVGQQMHPMSLLGGAQTELAQDGHPMKYATTVTAESIDPGTTMDALVTMPGINGTTADAKTATKIAVYEANGALDNNAQIAGAVAGQPTQVAFGGMLTFLDTQAPVDTSTDNTGPTAKSVTVSPTPSDALSAVTVTATISDAATGGSPIAAAEYVIDDDNPAGPLAPGSGMTMTVTDTTAVTTSATGTIPASVLAAATFAAGKHIVYVRGEDSKNNWGVVGSAVLNVPKTGPATTGGTATPTPTNGAAAIDISATGDDSTAGGKITAAEYFLDTPGANDAGTAMLVNRLATVVSADATLPATSAATLIEGVHHFWVHVKDDLGLWGPLLDIPVLIDKTGPTTLAASTSPPATNGVVADPSNPGYVQITAEVSDPNGALGSNLVAAEAFLGTAPAAASNGKGLQLRPIDGKIDSQDEHFYALIPLAQLKAYKDGQLPIYVHGKDAAGNWGDATLNPAKLLIDRVAPALAGPLTATLAAVGSPGIALTSTLTEANTLSNAEYWTGTTDPGVGKATAATLSVAAGAVTVNASFPATAVTTTYRVRVRDTAGNWSAAVAGTVSPFRSNLEATTGWNVTNGAAAISSAAAQLNPDENPSANGLQATVAPSPNSARTAFLTNNTPVKNTGYHARFQFQAPSLSSGTNTGNWVTVFDTRTADGANKGTEVFAVQYQGSGATAQIRAVVGGTAGAAKVIGAVSRTIQVDWSNGAAAKLVFSVDGSVQYTVSPGSVTTTIEAAQLGISNTSVATTNSVGPLGKAWYDTFLSVGS